MSFNEISINLINKNKNNTENQISLLKKLVSIPYPIPDIPQENVWNIKLLKHIFVITAEDINLYFL